MSDADDFIAHFDPRNQEGSAQPVIPASKLPSIRYEHTDKGRGQQFLDHLLSPGNVGNPDSPAFEHRPVRGWDSDYPRVLHDQLDSKRQRNIQRDLDDNDPNKDDRVPGEWHTVRVTKDSTPEEVGEAAKGIARILDQGDREEREIEHGLPERLNEAHAEGGTAATYVHTAHPMSDQEGFLRDRWHLSTFPRQVQGPLPEHYMVPSKKWVRKTWKRLIGPLACEHENCPPWEHREPKTGELLDHFEAAAAPRYFHLSHPASRDSIHGSGLASARDVYPEEHEHLGEDEPAGDADYVWFHRLPAAHVTPHSDTWELTHPHLYDLEEDDNSDTGAPPGTYVKVHRGHIDPAHLALVHEGTFPSHEAAARPARGEVNCGCCSASGSHGDGSDCGRCGGSGRIAKGDRSPYCAGQPGPKRRHWREAAAEPVRWLHGTVGDLRPGDLIDTGHPVTHAHAQDDRLENTGPGRSSKYTHATSSHEVASNYAWRAVSNAKWRLRGTGEEPGPPRVYEVEWTGGHEADPDGRSGDRRSASPLRVVREVGMYQEPDEPRNVTASADDGGMHAPPREYSAGRMLVSDIHKPGKGELAPRPYTQRQMAADIKRNGVEKPLTIEHATAYSGNPTVINGLHRLDAAERAGVAEVPVLVRHLPGQPPPMTERRPATEQEFNDTYDIERAGIWAGEGEPMAPRNAAKQQEGDERPYSARGTDYTMRYRTDDMGERKPRHIIETLHPDGSVIGRLNWYGTTGTVHKIEVASETESQQKDTFGLFGNGQDHQRRGIATAMWDWSQEMTPKAKHSKDQTREGTEWAGSLKGPRKDYPPIEATAAAELLGHFEASGEYRGQHTAPSPAAGHLPLHHYTGDDPDEDVRIYRSAPAGTESINTGDWISLSADYAHRHGRHATDSSKDWPVYTAEVPQRHVHWDENDEDEHGYNGPEIPHPEVHDEETGARASWHDWHEDHPHGLEAWTGASAHLSPEDHEFVHDEFEDEEDRSNRLLGAARAQGSLRGARWHDDLYPARDDAEGHAAARLHQVPEGRRLTAFTVHRDEAGKIADIGLHHYEPSDDPHEFRRYRNIGIDEYYPRYQHPAIEDIGRQPDPSEGRHEAALGVTATTPEYGPKPEHDWSALARMHEEDPDNPERSRLHRQYSDEDHAWKSNIRRGLSLGHLTYDRAKSLGYYGDGHESPEPTSHWWREQQSAQGKEPREFTGWQQMPHDLYHVTTDMPAVREHGLKSRQELGQAFGKGLGGGRDDTISLTSDKEMGHHILRAMHEYHDVLNGRKTPRDMWEEARAGTGADRPFHGELARYYNTDWKEGAPLPRGLDAALRGVKTKFGGLVNSQEEMDREEGPGWRPHRDSDELTGGDGVKRYNVWERDLTPEEKQHSDSDLYKNFSYWRSHAGSTPDPLFISNDVRGFAESDPSHFGMVHVHPRPGAQGFPVSSMDEWRTTTGDALEVHRAERLEGGHLKEAAMHEPGLPNPRTGGHEWFHGTQGVPENFSQRGFSADRGYDHEEAEMADHLPHWNGFIGPHFAAAHDVAEKFARAGASGERHDESDYEHFDDPWRESVPMSVIHARLQLKNPKHYASEHDMDDEAYEDEYHGRKNYIANHFRDGYEDEEPGKDEDDGGLEEPGGDGYEEWTLAARFRHDDKRPIAKGTMAPTRGFASRQPGHPLRTEWLNSHPDKHNIAARFRAKLEAQGHDGIVYGNEYERSDHHGQGSNTSAVAFRPHQVEIDQMHREDRECLSPAEAREQRARLPGPGQEELPFGEHEAALGVVAHFEAGEPAQLKVTDGHGTAHFGATDWDRFYDKIPGEIHRGLYAPESHGVLAVPQSDEDIAHQLIRAHQEEQFPYDQHQHELFGTHWSSDENVAHNFAQEHEREHANDDQCPDHDEHCEATPVVFHAQRPQRHEIENDPRRLGWQNVDDHDSPEQEVPIRHGAPVRITGVSWLKHTGLGPMWHRHDLREPVVLRAEDRDSPDDPDEWNGDRPAPEHYTASLGVVAHFEPPRGPFHQQKLFHMQPDPRRLPEGSPRHNPHDPEGHLHWRSQNDPDYEPDPCEHCGEDLRRPREHEEAHDQWLGQQDWYTDWSAEHPGDTLHRGIGADLPDDVHRVVHDESRPVHERAHALMSHLLTDGNAGGSGLGNFWSSDPDVSKTYAESYRRRFGKNNELTPVMFHAHTPDMEHFETDPDTLQHWGVYSYHLAGNREVPLQHGAPIRIKGISWAPPGHRDGDMSHHDPKWFGPGPHHLDQDPAWNHHEISGEGIRAHASGGEPAGPLEILAHFEVTAVQNPPCALCGEPLDDDDVTDGVSAHDECAQQHWCEAHQEEHDDPVLAQQHNDTYTDWGAHLPFGHGIHRGFPVQLPDKVHRAVHDESRPAEERAAILRRHLDENPSDGMGLQRRLTDEERYGEDSHLGVHWTDSEPHARGWGADDYYEGRGNGGVKPHVTHVVLHAASPAREHIEDDPDELESRHMYGFDHPRSEREVPLRVGAPVQLTGISWKRGGETDWRRHDFPAPSQHTAVLEATAMDDDGDRYVTCDQGHTHWGAHGAAGLLIRHQDDDGQTRYLLQHRSPHVQHGDTWSTPGGALHRGETPEAGAVREAEEEFGSLPAGLTHSHTVTDDHGGGWAYHTVVMDSPRRFTPGGGDEDAEWESSGHRWVTPEEMQGLPLHPGFAASWGRVSKSAALEGDVVAHFAVEAAADDDSLSWEEIGRRHPKLYGNEKTRDHDPGNGHGHDIGDAVAELYYDRPGHEHAEGTGETHPENHDEIRFYPRTVDTHRIDYIRTEPWDQRVQRAKKGFEGQQPGKDVPPLLLVHRHGVFQVADGHHRANGAVLAGRPSVRAYVAYSPHDEPFAAHYGEEPQRGPFNGASTEDRPAPVNYPSGERRRISYPGFPHTAEAGIPATPHQAALEATAVDDGDPDELWRHLQEEHGISQSGDVTRRPGAEFMRRIHDNFGDHRHQGQPASLSPMFTPIPAEELEARRKAAEPKPERLDDREYSIGDVSRHYDWEGFDSHEIGHLVHRPEQATFTKEYVPVHSLRHVDQHGRLVAAPSYHDIISGDEEGDWGERERLEGLERGYDEGANIPPAVVVRDGEHHIIADGSHRAAVHAKRGATHMPAFVTQRTIYPEQHTAARESVAGPRPSDDVLAHFTAAEQEYAGYRRENRNPSMVERHIEEHLRRQRTGHGWETELIPNRHFVAAPGSAEGGITHLFRGYMNGQLAGVIHAGISNNGQAWKIHGMHVTPGLREAGAAPALMDSFYDHAKASGGRWVDHGIKTRGEHELLGDYAEPHPEMNIHRAPPSERPGGWNDYFKPSRVHRDMLANAGNFPEHHAEPGWASTESLGRDVHKRWTRARGLQVQDREDAWHGVEWPHPVNGHPEGGAVVDRSVPSGWLTAEEREAGPPQHAEPEGPGEEDYSHMGPLPRMHAAPHPAISDAIGSARRTGQPMFVTPRGTGDDLRYHVSDAPHQGLAHLGVTPGGGWWRRMSGNYHDIPGRPSPGDIASVYGRPADNEIGQDPPRRPVAPDKWRPPMGTMIGAIQSAKEGMDVVAHFDGALYHARPSAIRLEPGEMTSADDEGYHRVTTRPDYAEDVATAGGNLPGYVYHVRPTGPTEPDGRYHIRSRSPFHVTESHIADAGVEHPEELLAELRMHEENGPDEGINHADAFSHRPRAGGGPIDPVFGSLETPAVAVLDTASADRVLPPALPAPALALPSSGPLAGARAAAAAIESWRPCNKAEAAGIIPDFVVFFRHLNDELRALASRAEDLPLSESVPDLLRQMGRACVAAAEDITVMMYRPLTDSPEGAWESPKA